MAPRAHHVQQLRDVLLTTPHAQGILHLTKRVLRVIPTILSLVVLVTFARRLRDAFLTILLVMEPQLLTNLVPIVPLVILKTRPHVQVVQQLRDV